MLWYCGKGFCDALLLCTVITVSFQLPQGIPVGPGGRPTSTHYAVSRDTGLRKSGPAAMCPVRVMFTHGGPVPEPPSAPRINAHSAIQGSFVPEWLSPGCCWEAGVLSLAPGQAAILMHPTALQDLLWTDSGLTGRGPSRA